MEFKFKLLALLISLSLTACGGSSGGGSDNNQTDTSENSSEDTESTDTSSGDDNSSTSDANNITGNCVTVARPRVGQVEIIKTKYNEPNDTFPPVYQETKIIAFSNTSSTTELTTRSGSATGKITNKSTTTSTYTIANNFQDTTQSISTGVSLITDETGAESLQEFKTVSVFSPPSHIPINRFCEGQTWTNDYDITTTTTANEAPSSYTIHSSGIYTIEAINVSKTVTAGTFNTIQLKIEDGSSIIRTWGDIETGLTIASEQKLTSGKLFSQSELISFTR